jgi:hypothetical protein
MPAPSAPLSEAECVEEFTLCHEYVKKYRYRDLTEFLCANLLEECKRTGEFDTAVYRRRIADYRKAERESRFNEDRFNLFDPTTWHLKPANDCVSGGRPDLWPF